MDISSFCLSLPEASVSPHFEKTSFRVRKKIFATLDHKKGLLVVKLSHVDQSVFMDMSKGSIQAVPGGWGKKGWTQVTLSDEKNNELIEDLIRTAYCEVAPDKLSNTLGEST